MSQLDVVTWFPQILWLFIIFFIIYTLLYKNFGPLSFYNQNLRNKKIENHFYSIISYNYLNVEIIFKRWAIFKSGFLN